MKIVRSRLHEVTKIALCARFLLQFAFSSLSSSLSHPRSTRRHNAIHHEFGFLFDTQQPASS